MNLLPSPSGVAVALGLATAAAAECANFTAHKRRIGAYVGINFPCSSAASCVAEAAAACNSNSTCHSFGISAVWHNASVAQLYPLHWNASWPNDQWTLYACSDDAPPRPPNPPPAKPGECKSDLDCSLNGLCDVASGECACDAPWVNGASGQEACNVLDVLPHPDDYVPAYGGPRSDTAWGPQNVTSWGGNILLGDDGKYHLWVSAMADGGGLNTWVSHSQIDHAVADDPMGVFHKVDTALQHEAHNSSPLRAPNGSYLLFHIGNSNVSSGGSSFLHHAETPAGPWHPLPSLNCGNPAPMRHSNGTYFCGCNNNGFSIFRTEDPFEGNWVKVTVMDFPTAWIQPSELRNEDPYLWEDSRGNFHFLAHRYDYRDGWPVNPNQTMPILVSGHGFSRDGVDWHFNQAEQPFDAVVTFENGTKQQFSTYERPHLLFNDKGQPTHLINGVQAYWDPPGAEGPCDKCDARPGSNHSCVVCKTTAGIDFTYTLVTALRV
eukprot:INCI4074.11.p1 GENE.INCI4074.11~~INCI4074.11.p1  ORF type:complete len:492 (-),score=45.36 INCI4074.11:1168-2643(-)